jgi:hypothetical protein
VPEAAIGIVVNGEYRNECIHKLDCMCSNGLVMFKIDQNQAHAAAAYHGGVDECALI